MDNVITYRYQALFLHYPFEDFVWNRSDGTPADVFKKLGDASYAYVTTLDCDAPRHSNLTYKLPHVDVEMINGLLLSKIKMLCSQSVFTKSKRFETIHRDIFSTQSSALNRSIQGQYRAARIYEQSITWGVTNSQSEDANSFNVDSIMVYCSCKYYNKETCFSGRCCSHIVGQLRRTVYLTTLN